MGLYIFERDSAPGKSEKIGISAFQNTGLTKIKIPDSVTSVDKMAFYECKNLTEIRIGSSLTSLHLNSFMGCYGLKRIESASSSYVSSDDNMFLMSKEGEVMLFASGCTLESYAFPETVKDLTLKKIGSMLLNNNTIKTVDLPSTLEVVGALAFRCDQISTVYSRSVTPAKLMWSDPVLGGGWFVGDPKPPFQSNKCTFYVPAESIDAYKAAWAKYGLKTFLPL